MYFPQIKNVLKDVYIWKIRLEKLKSEQTYVSFCRRIFQMYFKNQKFNTKLTSRQTNLHLDKLMSCVWIDACLRFTSGRTYIWTNFRLASGQSYVIHLDKRIFEQGMNRWDRPTSGQTYVWTNYIWTFIWTNYIWKYIWTNLHLDKLTSYIWTNLCLASGYTYA